MGHIIGCGTGRCGSVSLSKLLNHCDYIYCTHERRPHLPWEFDEATYKERLQDFKTYPNRHDVAFYYLPYLERFLTDLENLHVLVLKRDREETVQSFMNVLPNKGTREGNPWNDMEKWGRHFPQYSDLDKERAAGKYWDEYYLIVEELVKHRPNQIKIVPMEMLNTIKGQDEIFEFCGIPDKDRKYMENCRYNSTDDWRRLHG